MYPPGFLIDGGGTPSGIDIIYAPIGVQSDDHTSVSIDFSTINLTDSITKYTVTARRYQSDGTTLISADPVPREFTSKPLVITNLTPGGNYVFQIDTYHNSTKGLSSLYFPYQLSQTQITAGMLGNTDVKTTNLTPGKAYLTLKGATTGTNASLVYKTFDAINVTAGTTSSYGSGLPSYITDTLTTYSTQYFGFGTSIMLDNPLTNTAQSAGIGIFADNAGGTGYFLVIESTASAAMLSKKSFRILKVKGNQVLYELTTSQTDNGGSVDGVIGGKEYQIDVKAKVSGNTVTFIISVNGFQMIAQDTQSVATAAGSKGVMQILSPTNKIALVCFKGMAAFDYVYGSSITAEQYGSYLYATNFYKGQFSNDFLQPQFGDLVYNADRSSDGIPAKGISYDEFGTTARQILKTDIKFDSRPAYPINPSTGLNKLAKIIAHKINNFGATVYVLNNSSAVIPLSDGNANTFWVYGNTLGQSGELEYITEDNDYMVKEPITISTNWLQNLSDVKKLGDWIKSKVINRGNAITITCFGNPLINPGDIITIKYPYKKLSGTERFIVTSVTQNYSDGLETEISCRTL